MVGHRLIVLLLLTVQLTSSQRWPNFKDLFHRLRMYQANPRAFRPERIGPPSQKRNAEMSYSYSQKKAALKRLLQKSAGEKEPSHSVAPLALSLLQKLKQKPPQPDIQQTLKTQVKSEPSRLFSTLPVNKVKAEPSGEFSPPRNLDSGFTPFFQQSKAFDEESYLEAMNTTEDTTETTIGVTLSVEEATQMFGEKKETKEPMKNSMKFYKKYLPQSKKPTVKTIMVKKEYKPKKAPFEDLGFTKNWNFESERNRFYDSDDAFQVGSPMEQTSPTVPFVGESQTPVRESFDDWERKLYWNKEKEAKKNTKRRYDDRDFVRNRPVKTKIYSQTPRPDITERKSSDVQLLEGNDDGFMESVPFTFPEEIEMFPGKSFNDFHWAKEEVDIGTALKSKQDSSTMRDIERFDQDRVTYHNQEHQQETHSFGDDFTFSKSRIGNFFNDIDDKFPSIVKFGSPWESTRFR